MLSCDKLTASGSSIPCSDVPDFFLGVANGEPVAFVCTKCPTNYSSVPNYISFYLVLFLSVHIHKDVDESGIYIQNTLTDE